MSNRSSIKYGVNVDGIYYEFITEEEVAEFIKLILKHKTKLGEIRVYELPF